MTLEEVAAAALRYPDVASALRGALTSDLVVASPFLRQIAEFATEFRERHESLPKDGDWKAWIEELPERKKSGVLKVLRRLRDLNLDAFTPGFIAEHAGEVLHEAAARTAIGRLQGVEGNRVAALRDLTEQVDAVRPRDEEPGAGLFTFAELLQDPKVLEPPPAMVRGIAWRGRSTLLASREKLGKSTLAGAVAAAVSSATPFLGHVPMPRAGTVLYVTLDENPEETARRLVAFRADPERVYGLVRLREPGEPVQELEQAVRETQPDLVVVDTLAELVRDIRPESGAASQWTPVVGGLTRIARDHDLAMLVLHHTVKSGKQYRDSTAIGASVDLIVTMTERKQDSRGRFLKAQGRLHVPDRTIRLNGDPMRPEDNPRWERGHDPGPSLEERIVEFVRGHPGVPTRGVVEGVPGKTTRITDAISDLLDSCALEDRAEPGEQRRRLHVSEEGDGEDRFPAGALIPPERETVWSGEADDESNGTVSPTVSEDFSTPKGVEFERNGSSPERTPAIAGNRFPDRFPGVNIPEARARENSSSDAPEEDSSGGLDVDGMKERERRLDRAWEEES